MEYTNALSQVCVCMCVLKEGEGHGVCAVNLL